jgi:hypothetical protein
MFKLDAFMIRWCIVASLAAVAYAQFDEEFGDMIGWIRRDLHYGNDIKIGCSAYTCERATWTPGIGRHRLEWSATTWSTVPCPIRA